MNRSYSINAARGQAPTSGTVLPVPPPQNHHIADLEAELRKLQEHVQKVCQSFWPCPVLTIFLKLEQDKEKLRFERDMAKEQRMRKEGEIAILRLNSNKVGFPALQMARTYPMLFYFTRIESDMLKIWRNRERPRKRQAP